MGSLLGLSKASYDPVSKLLTKGSYVGILDCHYGVLTIAHMVASMIEAKI